MAWTTKIVHVDLDTGEVLQKAQLHAYTQINQERIINKINATHTEIIIIKIYARSKQTTIWG